MGCYSAFRCAEVYFHFPTLETTSGTGKKDSCFGHCISHFWWGEKLIQNGKSVNSCLGKKHWIVSGCLELYDFMSLNYHSLNNKHLTWKQINAEFKKNRTTHSTLKSSSMCWLTANHFK